jgi:hypothetical protein
MIQITFTKPTEPNQLNEFDAWLNDCVSKQNQLNQAMFNWINKWLNMPAAPTAEEKKEQEKQKKDEKPKVDADVYSGQKNYYASLNGMFFGKCAYCETSIFQGFSGDIEHFRPKGNVKDSNGRTAKTKINNIETEHPGYYWLAYNSQNLLLSCELCNRPNKQRSSDNRTIGKHDFFPLETDFRASKPGDEVNELPSLLNPLLDNPDDHLKIDETGVLTFTTSRGDKTIRLLGLNERDLPNARREKYLEVRRLVIDWYGEVARRNTQSANDLLEKINKIKKGNGTYTIIARKAIKDTIDEINSATNLII